MSPENQWLEDVCFIKVVPFLGYMLVFRDVDFFFGRGSQPSPLRDMDFESFKQLEFP